MQAVVLAAGLLSLIGLLSLWQWWALVTGRVPSWNRMDWRIQVPWNGGDVLLLSFLALMLEVLCVGAVSRWQSSPPGTLTIEKLLAGNLAHLVWLALAMLYLIQVRGALADDLGLETTHLRRNVRLGVKTFMIAVLPVYIVQISLVHFMPSNHPLVEFVRARNSSIALMVVALTAVVLVPFYEEFLFRVLLQGWLEKQEAKMRAAGGLKSWLPGMWSIGISSLIFAVLHAGHGPDPIPIFVLAMFLGYVYRRTHRIYASLATHTAINALAMLQLWIQQAASIS